MKNLCQEALDKGRDSRKDQRRDYPMLHSMYKLKEVLRLWNSYCRELDMIGRCATGCNTSCYALRHCTRDDKSKWVKDLPTNMMNSLGNVVEVLPALGGNGVPCDVIVSVMDRVEKELPRLVELGETARLDAKNDWNAVAKSLAAKQGSVYDFTHAMKDFLEEIINEVDVYEDVWFAYLKSMENRKRGCP